MLDLFHALIVAVPVPDLPLGAAAHHQGHGRHDQVAQQEHRRDRCAQDLPEALELHALASGQMPHQHGRPEAQDSAGQDDGDKLDDDFDFTVFLGFHLLSPPRIQTAPPR